MQTEFVRVFHNMNDLRALVTLQTPSVSVKFGELGQSLKGNYAVICIMSFADDGR